MSAFGIKIDPPLTEVFGQLALIPERAIASAMPQSADLMLSFVHEEIDIWQSTPAASNVNRTGNLRGSFEAENDEDSAGVFSALPYAKIHNRGGTIRAVQAAKLAIPLTREAASRPPRFFGDLFFITSKKGNDLLVRAKKGKLEPLYFLTEEVQIPARNYLDNAADRSALPIAELIGERVVVEAGELL